MKSCPAIRATFHRLVNMSPSEIRAWAKDPRAKLASFESTRRRLPALADLAAKRGEWTAKDCTFGARVNSFNARMQGMVDKWGCKPRALRSLRNWGRMSPACRLEDINGNQRSVRPRRR